MYEYSRCSKSVLFHNMIISAISKALRDIIMKLTCTVEDLTCSRIHCTTVFITTICGGRDSLFLIMSQCVSILVVSSYVNPSTEIS